MGLVASSKDSLTEASAGLEARRGESGSHVFRGKNDLICLGQHDSEGTYGNVGIWALFSGQQGIIAACGYDICPGLIKQVNLIHDEPDISGEPDT